MSPRGDKSSYTSKQRRQAHHIERSVMKRGRSRKTAERIGWATVNKETGGGKRKRTRSASSRQKSTRPKRSSSSRGGSRRRTASRSR